MGLFKSPPTPEELEQQKRYEASKERLLALHRDSSVIFYIDEVQTTSAPPVLIGDVGKGILRPDMALTIYSCEGLPVGTMTVAAINEQQDKVSFFEKRLRTYCTPAEDWDGYIPGQLLAVQEAT